MDTGMAFQLCLLGESLTTPIKLAAIRPLWFNHGPWLLRSAAAMKKISSAFRREILTLREPVQRLTFELICVRYREAIELADDGRGFSLGLDNPQNIV